MNPNWKYVPFNTLFGWCVKSNIGSRQAVEGGKYTLYIASATERKEYNDYLYDGEALIFGTGGNPAIHYATGKFAYTNHTEAAIAKSNDVISKFYYYYFHLNGYAQLRSTFVGGGIKNSSKKKIGELLVPVVGFEEQKHIVAKIEELFSELDNSVETLQKTKEQLTVYRQAILKEAFKNIENFSPINEMSTLVTSGSRGWAQYYSPQGAKFIRIGNLTRNSINIDLNDIQHVDLPDRAEGLRSKLKPNDVLVSITADLGSIGLVPQNIGDAYINQHIAVVRFRNPNQGKFMAWFLRSEQGQKDLLKNKRGAGKLGLGLDDIRASKVPNISNEEAKAILDSIDSQLSVCKNIENTVDSALQQAEALRQSILKKAFEGEL